MNIKILVGITQGIVHIYLKLFFLFYVYIIHKCIKE